MACIKHELKQCLKFIDVLENRDLNLNEEKNILSVGLKFELNLDTLTQPWIGGYCQSEEYAQKTFK